MSYCAVSSLLKAVRPIINRMDSLGTRDFVFEESPTACESKLDRKVRAALEVP